MINNILLLVITKISQRDILSLNPKTLHNAFQIKLNFSALSDIFNKKLNITKLKVTISFQARTDKNYFKYRFYNIRRYYYLLGIKNSCRYYQRGQSVMKSDYGPLSSCIKYYILQSQVIKYEILLDESHFLFLLFFSYKI